HLVPAQGSEGLALVGADLDAVVLEDEGVGPAGALQQAHLFGLGADAVLVAQVPDQGQGQPQHRQDGAQQQGAFLGAAGVAQDGRHPHDSEDKGRPPPQPLAPEAVEKGKAAEAGRPDLDGHIDGKLFHGPAPWGRGPAGRDRRQKYLSSTIWQNTIFCKRWQWLLVMYTK